MENDSIELPAKEKSNSEEKCYISKIYVRSMEMVEFALYYR